MKYLLLTLVILTMGCEDETAYYNCKDANRILMKEFVEKCIENGIRCTSGNRYYEDVVETCTINAKKIFCSEPKHLKD
jgi:hypothetical protein